MLQASAWWIRALQEILPALRMQPLGIRAAQAYAHTLAIQYQYVPASMRAWRQGMRMDADLLIQLM